MIDYVTTTTIINLKNLLHDNEVWNCNSDVSSKYFFVYKYIKIKFFYFLKIIFDISISKQFENIKKIILNK
jgi:hypothetical protein